jgi:hypothetical protein
MRDENPSGQKAVWVDQTPYLLIWSGRPDIARCSPPARPESICRQILSKKDVTCALADSEGPIWPGSRTGIAHAMVRAGAETDLPWNAACPCRSTVTEKGMAAAVLSDAGHRIHGLFSGLATFRRKIQGVTDLF